MQHQLTDDTIQTYQHLPPCPFPFIDPGEPVSDIVLSDVLKPMLDQFAGTAAILADGVGKRHLGVPECVQHATRLVANYAISAHHILEAWEENPHSCRCRDCGCEAREG